MNKNGNIKNLIIATVFVLWSAIVLSAFYITQHPIFLQVFKGILGTLWAILLTIILLIDAACLGSYILKKISLEVNPHQRLIFGIGLGLGILGFLGYGLAAVGWANIIMLSLFLFATLIWGVTSKLCGELWSNLHSLVDSFQDKSGVPRWLPAAVFSSLALGFLFALLPPAEGFDGLIYHLTLPENMLANKTILLPNNFSFWYWYPGLVEGNFVWALAFGSERTAQFTHWSYSILVAALVWEWAGTINKKTAWWSLAILASLPSLPWLSSWAYNDFALAFFGLASLYALWRWSETKTKQWLVLCGIFSGMAMGVKYTSFLIPTLCFLFILTLGLTPGLTPGRTWSERIKSVLLFSVIVLLVASPWYIRNWVIMNNPFYPFVFGGRYWDSFLAAWTSKAGSGIGWNFTELLLLPFTISLGYRDQTFYDGRIGPLFLLTLPLIPFMVWKKRLAPKPQRTALLIIIIYSTATYLFWTLGVIQTISLWQTRYLWQALIPLAIPIGLSIEQLSSLDHPRLRISFIFNFLFGLVMLITIFDNLLSLTNRRPLAYAFGLETRQEYFERMQPNYAEALRLVEKTPQDAYVYFIFEPRSYNMPRKVQPDAILGDLLHDYYLYVTAEKIITRWKSIGYTHVLIYLPGAQLTKQNGETFESQTNDILKHLKLISKLKNYALYSIP